MQNKLETIFSQQSNRLQCASNAKDSHHHYHQKKVQPFLVSLSLSFSSLAYQWHPILGPLFYSF